MARAGNQKLEILYLLQMLSECKTQSQGISMQEIIEKMAEHGLYVDRKEVQEDVKALRSFGISIAYCRRRPGGYYIDGDIPSFAKTQPVFKKEEVLATTLDKTRNAEGKKIKLCVSPELLPRVQAYFGEQTQIRQKKDGLLSIKGTAVLDYHFYGWLSGCGDKLYLQKPKKAVRGYREYLQRILKKYKENE